MADPKHKSWKFFEHEGNFTVCLPRIKLYVIFNKVQHNFEIFTAEDLSLLGHGSSLCRVLGWELEGSQVWAKMGLWQERCQDTYNTAEVSLSKLPNP